MFVGWAKAPEARAHAERREFSMVGTLRFAHPTPHRYRGQNIRPPIGTSLLGRSSTTSPASSGTPSVSTSDMKGPI